MQSRPAIRLGPSSRPSFARQRFHRSSLNLLASATVSDPRRGGQPFAPKSCVPPRGESGESLASIRFWCLGRCRHHSDRGPARRPFETPLVRTAGRGHVCASFHGAANFATDVLLLGPSGVEILFALGRRRDAISDPIVGTLIDLARTRPGRRRPWMLASIPLLMARLIMIASRWGYWDLGPPPDPPTGDAVKRFVIETMVTVLAFAMLGVAGGCTNMGKSATGERLERMKASPNYGDGEFVNLVPTELLVPGTLWANVSDRLFGDEVRHPPWSIPVIPLRSAELNAPPSPNLRVVWMGHATTLVEMEGTRIMTDPVFSNVVSPVSWVGPARMHPTPVELEALPPIDLVVISHDHYDHLDMTTVQHLAARGTRFAVGLGIGAHLESWGVPVEQIHEMDWWDTIQLGPIRVVCTPARHYSGRGIFDSNETLWSSWTLIGASSRLYYSGDTGFSEHFAEIGRRYGPFDLSLVKIGAYAEYWPDIHMTPEEAVDAQIALGGGRMVPVHWATFNLQYAAWDEPILRAVADAQAKGVDIATPKIGEWVTPSGAKTAEAWWISPMQGDAQNAIQQAARPPVRTGPMGRIWSILRSVPKLSRPSKRPSDRSR